MHECIYPDVSKPLAKYNLVSLFYFILLVRLYRFGNCSIDTNVTTLTAMTAVTLMTAVSTVTAVTATTALTAMTTTTAVTAKTTVTGLAMVTTVTTLTAVTLVTALCNYRNFDKFVYFTLSLSS